MAATTAWKREDGLVQDGFTGVEGAREFLGVSRSTLYKLMDSGELPYAKFGKCRKVPRRALSEYAARHMVARQEG